MEHTELGRWRPAGSAAQKKGTMEGMSQEVERSLAFWHFFVWQSLY